MHYLYGDSSPFPLQENFLDNLSDLTRTVVTILQIDEAIRLARERTRQAKQEAFQARGQLAALGEALMGTLQDQLGSAPPAMVTRTAEVLQQISRRVIDDARHDVVSQHERGLRELEQAIQRERASVRPLLGRYLLRHELPDSEWELGWRVDSSTVTAEASACAACGLAASYRLVIPEASRWTRAIRVGDLSPGLRVELPRRSALRRRPRLRPVKLSKLLVTGAELSAGCSSLSLRWDDRHQGEGYRLTQSGDEPPVIRSLEQTAGEIHLAGTEAEEVRRLLQVAAQDLLPLTHERGVVIDLTLDRVPVGELEDLTRLARVLIGAVAHLVREIVLRSPSNDELSLKRVVGERRREEIYLPTRELTEMIGSLRREQRLHFGPFGILPAALRVETGGRAAAA
jgi:hypothetical protein